jgi:hypothetical protein
MTRLIINDDGYINLNRLCKTGGKDFKEWKRNKKSKVFLDILSKTLNINKTELIKYEINSKTDQSNWGHPLVATYVAQWISVDFAVKVSIWIDEWKNYKNTNLLLYNEEIENIIPDQNIQTEKEIQLRLQEELKGDIEVKTEDGYIDLLTDTEIIEIKNGDNWKHGFGQLEIYSISYPSHTKRLHLFNIEPNLRINKCCEKYNIKVTYEN